MDDIEAPLCKCGCGEHVKWGKQNRCWNKFIIGHQSRDAAYWNKQKLKLKEPPLCACGCGKKVKWSKWNNRWNKVLYNHPINRGATHTEEVKLIMTRKMKERWSDTKYKEKMCVIFKRRAEDPEFIKKLSEKGKERWKNPSFIGNSTEWRENQGKKTKQNWKDHTFRETVTQAIKDRWSNSKFKEKMADIMKKVQGTEEYKENASKRFKELWKDQRHIEKQTKQMKKNWENPEYREKQTERMRGENHPNWKGGITCEPYCKIWTFSEFKEMIRERDSWKCKNPDCWGKKFNGKPTIHHINYNKKDCHPLNLITVCRSCNTRANYKRDSWQEFYTNIMKRRFKNNGLTKREYKPIIKKTK